MDPVEVDGGLGEDLRPANRTMASGGVVPLDASRASAEAGGGRRVAAGAGHALRVLLARGGRRLAGPVGCAEPGGLGQHR